MTDQWIEVDEYVLSEACHQLDPHPRKMGDTTTVNRQLIEAMIAYFEEVFDGCDHSVGICQCGTRNVLEDLHLALDGKIVCRLCGGDGCVWSQERYDRELVRWQADPEKRNWDMSESYGMVDCAACHGAGKVPA